MCDRDSRQFSQLWNDCLSAAWHFAALPPRIKRVVDDETELIAIERQCPDTSIMFKLRLAMIQLEPPITRNTISTPKASAMILFVLSGPLPRCRKKTR